MKRILKVLVGSQAHGLATPESDYDYRGVFLAPTEELLSIGNKTKTTNWIEGNEDDTSWELGQFLELSIHSNPTVLETYLAPVVEEDNWGCELRNLFPSVWDSKRVVDAFVGYAHAQRKKFLEDKDKRANKYASAHIRVLYNCYELLTTGSFSVNLISTPVYELAKRFKEGQYEPGEVIQETLKWEKLIFAEQTRLPEKKADFNKINEFLIKARKSHWST